MRTKYYINRHNGGSEPITKKNLCLMIGEDTVKRLTDDAKQQFIADPYVLNQYMVRSGGILTIKFIM